MFCFELIFNLKVKFNKNIIKLKISYTYDLTNTLQFNLAEMKTQENSNEGMQKIYGFRNKPCNKVNKIKIITSKQLIRRHIIFI